MFAPAAAGRAGPAHCATTVSPPRPGKPSGGSPWRAAPSASAADDLGVSYVAAFAAHKRVGRMLRTEGKRHLAERSFAAPEAIASDKP